MVRSKPIDLEKACELLGTESVPGSREQVNMLCIRIRELVDLNGEAWVRQNGRKLLGQWKHLVTGSWTG